MTKSLPHWGPSLLPTTIATSNKSKDQISLQRPAQPDDTLPCSRDSLPCSTKVSIDNPQDHTQASSVAQSAHYQAGLDARIAFSNFVSFMDERDRIQPIHKEDYPKDREVCQEALRAATSASANESEIKTNLSQFDKVWSDLPEYIIRKNQAPDLTEEEYIEYEDRWLRMDYHRAKFEAMALNPDGCTERLKDDDSLRHGHELDSELLDTAYLEFS